MGWYWGYDIQPGSTSFNTVSDEITIDADHGAAAYGNSPNKHNMVQFFTLIVTNGGNTPPQEAELNLQMYGDGGPVFSPAYRAGEAAQKIQFFNLPVVQGHVYSRSIHLVPGQIVYTLTDKTTGQTQTIQQPNPQQTSAPWNALGVGPEWATETGAFPPQVDATIRNLRVDGRIISPSVPHHVLNPGARVENVIVPFSVTGGSYRIVGAGRGVTADLCSTLPPVVNSLLAPLNQITGDCRVSLVVVATFVGILVSL